jgi:hypothetical protein
MGRAEVPGLCEQPYTRSDGRVILCTFRHGHLSTAEASTPHSWTWLRDAERALRQDDTPSDVQAILDAITAGRADPYLEAILAVTHNRKRALRGVRGFPLLREQG